MRRGLFITLEGGDGAGKSTQIEFIRKFFEDKGLNVIVTREPGGTAISEKLRDILLDPDNGEMSPVTEMIIYAASRAQIVSELIKPAIERGDVVICDRFLDSSIAYQGYGRNLGDAVSKINEFAVDGLKPDITFWLNLNPELGRSRIKGRAADYSPDRLERENKAFHDRVYCGYERIAENEPDRVRNIDASRSVEEIREDIISALNKLCQDRNI